MLFFYIYFIFYFKFCCVIFIIVFICMYSQAVFLGRKHLSQSEEGVFGLLPVNWPLCSIPAPE